MRKAIVICMIASVLLLNPLALAIGPFGQGTQTAEGEVTEGKTTQATKEKIVESHVQGLEKAKMVVKNEEQKQLIEQVMNRITEQKRETLQKLENLQFKEEDGEVMAEGKKEMKFLGLIKMKRTARYEISEQGEVQRRHGIFDFLFTEVE